MKQLGWLRAFICSIILLFIAVVLITGSVPIKEIIFVLHVKICSPYLQVTVSSLGVLSCSSSWFFQYNLVVHSQQCHNAFTSWSSISFNLMSFPFCNNIILCTFDERSRWTRAGLSILYIKVGCVNMVEASWNVMAHAQKPDFVSRTKRTSPFKSAGGRQFSRLLAAEVCASAVVMLDTPCSEVEWRLLATHCIRQFPLHFLSRASPCAITFQLDCT